MLHLLYEAQAGLEMLTANPGMRCQVRHPQALRARVAVGGRPVGRAAIADDQRGIAWAEETGAVRRGVQERVRARYSRTRGCRHPPRRPLWPPGRRASDTGSDPSVGSRRVRSSWPSRDRLPCYVIERTRARRFTCRASRGRCSLILMPGTAVAISRKGPPFL